MAKNIVKVMVAGLGVLLLTMFNNCGRVGFDADRWAAWDAASSAVCDGELKNTYSTTYFPYLSTSCWNCHSSAHGSTDLNVSWASFKAKTAATIDIKAADGHNGLIGSNQTAAINAFKPQWNAANQRYLACVAAGPGNGGGPAGSVRLIPKTVTNLEATRTNRNTWGTLAWNLETETTAADLGKYKLSYRIEARYALNGTTVVGLEFRNPIMRLTVAGTPLAFNGMNLYMDGTLATDVTAYITLNATIPDINDVPLAPGGGFPFAYNPAASATTQVAFEITNLRNADGSTTGGSTGGATGGGVTGGTPATVSFTQLAGTNPALNVFAASCFACHRAGNAAGGLDMTVYANSRAAAANIRARMNNMGNPMPPSGVLNGARIDLVDVWINTGTPQ